MPLTHLDAGADQADSLDPSYRLDDEDDPFRGMSPEAIAAVKNVRAMQDTGDPRAPRRWPK